MARLWSAILVLPRPIKSEYCFPLRCCFNKLPYLIGKKNMCLFPSPVKPNTPAYEKGLRGFDCGACPECLSKRARLWALRCSMEAKKGKACMITLTYDTYIYDENGNIIGEQVADRSVDKKDAQDFVKRLRSHYDDRVKGAIRKELKNAIRRAFAVSPVKNEYRSYRDFRNRYVLRAYKNEIEAYKKNEFEKRKISIKYLLTAEYGKRTGRPHYHALLFGVDFAEDRTPYKKSKRGNAIFTSNTLNKIWNNGICTVDCVNVTSKVARYCTKYCAKDARAADTFMLVSRGIGDEYLMKEFNGLYYMVDGREYPIPKLIWNKIIEKRIRKNWIYNKNLGGLGHYSYRSYKWIVDKFPEYGHWLDLHLRKCRRWFREFRDRQKDYVAYIDYWHKRGELYDAIRGNVFQRILALPNEKYFGYKQAALNCYAKRWEEVLPIPPRANAARRFAAEFYKAHRAFIQEDGSIYLSRRSSICPPPSRHIRANDRQKQLFAKNKVITRADGKRISLHFIEKPNYISPF